MEIKPTASMCCLDDWHTCTLYYYTMGKSGFGFFQQV